MYTLIKQDLINTIANGIDNVDQYLIIDVNGQFKLHSVDFIQRNVSFQYIARLEAFDESKGYVGIQASKDHNFINTLFSRADRLLQIHNQTGDLNLCE